MGNTKRKKSIKEMILTYYEGINSHIKKKVLMDLISKEKNGELRRKLVREYDTQYGVSRFGSNIDPSKKIILLNYDEWPIIDNLAQLLVHDIPQYNIIDEMNPRRVIERYIQHKNDIQLFVTRDPDSSDDGKNELLDKLLRINPSLKTVLINEKSRVYAGKHHILSLRDVAKEVQRVLLYNRTEKTDIISEFIGIIDPEKNLKGEEIEFLFEKLKMYVGLTKEGLSDIVKSDKGFTSKTGFEFNDRYIKVDLASRLIGENNVYSLDLGSFNVFRPNINRGEFIVGNGIDIAILAMDNLNYPAKYISGLIKANLFKSPLVLEFRKEKSIGYNLFLMGLFHKEATKHIDLFKQIIYQGVDGLPHWEEGNEPYKNVKGTAFDRFIQTRIDSEAVIPFILEHRVLQQHTANTVIHGDWKDDNLVNGHLVDYAMVGRGFEVDELAYYLSDCKFNLGLDQFHRMIDEYVFLRSTHDPEFAVRVDNGYKNTMHQMANAAFLSQLVLRHSVMNKRDLADDSKFEQRRYYQHRINEVLREGRFN